MQFEVITEEAKAAVSRTGNSRLEVFGWTSSDESRFHPLLITQHTSIEGKSPANYRRNSGHPKLKLSCGPFLCRQRCNSAVISLLGLLREAMDESLTTLNIYDRSGN